MSATTRAVYRALIGGYEELREEPIALQSEIPFICFTDDPSLTSDTWEVVVVEPRLPHDAARSARALKILGHPRLAEYQETLWVDNTVELRRPPEQLLDLWLQEADVAAPLHSYRTSVLAEAEAVLDAGLDDFARVYEQVSHYVRQRPDALDENPHWTGMLARRGGSSTVVAMQSWWEQVLRYSRRDQLSFVSAMRAHGVRLESVALHNHASDWHAWPRARGRELPRPAGGLREALRPPQARLGRLELALHESAADHATSVAAREELLAAREQTIALQVETIRSLETRLADTVAQLESGDSRFARAEQERIQARTKLRKTRTRERKLHRELGKVSEQLRSARQRIGRLEDRPEPVAQRLRRHVSRLLRGRSTGSGSRS